MTKIKCKKIQKISDGVLYDGYRVKVEHNGQTKEKDCEVDKIYGRENIWSLCVILDTDNYIDKRLPNTNWEETLPYVEGKKCEEMHQHLIYNSFGAFDADGWSKCSVRDFVWECEQNMTN